VSSRHAIVVFGCPPRADGTVTPALRRRLERVLAEAREDPEALVVVTGGESNGPAEGVLMCEWLVVRGLTPERIAVESRARWTIENAVLVTPILREHAIERVSLVTASSHMQRARLMLRLALRRAGLGNIDVRRAPAADGQQDRARMTRAVEAAKTVWSLVTAPIWLAAPPRPAPSTGRDSP